MSDSGERRRDPRIEVGIPAKLRLVGLTVDGRLANVSARGVCFVTTDRHLRVDTANFVEVQFALPDDPVPLVRAVRVTRVEPADVDGAAGRRIGLELSEPLVLDALTRPVAD